MSCNKAVVSANDSTLIIAHKEFKCWKNKQVSYVKNDFVGALRHYQRCLRSTNRNNTVKFENYILNSAVKIQQVQKSNYQELSVVEFTKVLCTCDCDDVRYRQ